MILPCRSRSSDRTINGFTNTTTDTNGKAYGGRFRVYPFPLDSNLGRLELRRLDLQR